MSIIFSSVPQGTVQHPTIYKENYLKQQKVLGFIINKCAKIADESPQRFCPIWWLIVLYVDKSVHASTYFLSKACSPQAFIISSSLKEPSNFKVYFVILNPLVLFWQRPEPKRSTIGVQLVEMSLKAHIAQPVNSVYESWKRKEIKPNIGLYCNPILQHL